MRTRMKGRCQLKLTTLGAAKVCFLEENGIARVCEAHFCSEQRAKGTCLHVHFAVLCAGSTRLAPTEVERRPAARVKYPDACIDARVMPCMLVSTLE